MVSSLMMSISKNLKSEIQKGKSKVCFRVEDVTQLVGIEPTIFDVPAPNLKGSRTPGRVGPLSHGEP